MLTLHCTSGMGNDIMSQMSKAMTACDGLRGGLPGSRRGFANRGRRKAGLGLRSASLPLGEATPRHQKEPQEILPMMYRQSSAWCNTHTHTHCGTLTGKVHCSLIMSHGDSLTVTQLDIVLVDARFYKVNRNNAAVRDTHSVNVHSPCPYK